MGINLGSGGEHRVIDLANMVNELVGNEAGVMYVERRDWDVKHRLLSSIEKAKKLLNYKSQMEFEEGLKRVPEQTLGKFVVCRNEHDKKRNRFEIR